MTSLPLVSTEEEIAAFAAAAATSQRIGLDTEFMRERTYRARLCLVQIATVTDLVLIDPTAGVTLDPIAELIAKPDIEIVLHAGKQDLELFYERYEVIPRNVFDIQVAAGFAGHGASLPYGRLIGQLLDVTLTKGEAYTDWCRRPLSAEQLSYAADDVRYLLPAADRLSEELRSLGRHGWVTEEMRLLFEDGTAYPTDPLEAWRRVGGRGTLSSTQTAVLREVAAWRELEAQRRDLPRGWVVKDPTVVEIARRSPTSAGALKSIRGLNPKEAQRSGREIIAAVRRGRAADPIASRPAPPRAAAARARMLSGLADAIVRARCEHARIATELVATRGDLEAVLVDVVTERLDPSNHRLLQGWRRELAGEAVLALAEGRIAVRAIDGPPYIEEVPLN